MFKIVDAQTRRSFGLPLYSDLSAAKRVAADLGGVVVIVRVA